MTNPFLSSLSDFVLGKGVAISFGLVAAMATVLYQARSQRSQDILRRNEKKLNWMLDNMKYQNTNSDENIGTHEIPDICSPLHSIGVRDGKLVTKQVFGVYQIHLNR